MSLLELFIVFFRFFIDFFRHI